MPELLSREKPLQVVLEEDGDLVSIGLFLDTLYPASLWQPQRVCLSADDDPIDSLGEEPQRVSVDPLKQWLEADESHWGLHLCKGEPAVVGNMRVGSGHTKPAVLRPGVPSRQVYGVFGEELEGMMGSPRHGA